MENDDLGYKQQGPWGGGGGGGGGNPWGGGGGGGNWGGRGGGGGATPPDLEDLLRRSQERVRRFIPGGMGTGRGFLIIAAIVLGLWGLSGFYRVQPDEQGVELLFGKYVKTTPSGLNYWLPAPIGEVIKPKVTQTNQIPIGYRGAAGGQGSRDVPQESLMLTGDENIIDIKFTVQWRIRDAGEFLFNMRNPEDTVKIAAESAVREIVGRTNLQSILTRERESVAQSAQDLLQSIMDNYKSGVTILDVQIQGAEPPKEVRDAFDDVQRANQDRERLINEANAYRNDIVPRAKGEAARMVENANAQKERLVKEAEGQASRFTAFYETYAANKDITARRMYLEAMQEVLGKADKVIMDEKGSGVVPYLPLPELQKKSQQGAQP
jgi:membrane protease subunit HflK